MTILILFTILALVCSILTIACLVCAVVHTPILLIPTVFLAFWSVVLWKDIIDRMDEEDISFGWYEYEDIWTRGYEEGYSNGYSAAKTENPGQATDTLTNSVDPSRICLGDILEWVDETAGTQPLDITIIVDGLTHDFKHIEDIYKIESKLLNRPVLDSWSCLGPDGKTLWIQIILENEYKDI